MDADPIANDTRKTLRSRRLPLDAACELCGMADPLSLIRADRSLLQGHHVAARVNDPELVLIVCRNCHALLTEDQRDGGIDFDRTRRPNLLERIVAILRGIATVFRRWADHLWSQAGRVSAVIDWLDAHAPAWREAPEFR